MIEWIGKSALVDDGSRFYDFNYLCLDIRTMEPEVTIPITELITYAIGFVVAFLIPYLIWLHNRVIENKQNIAVNTANDQTVSGAIEKIGNEIHIMNTSIASLQSDISGIKVSIEALKEKR